MPPEPTVVRRKLNTTIMVVGNLSVGKSCLIRCLTSGQSMRGVDIPVTLRFDEDTKELNFDNETVKIKFIDVAGVNSAVDLIN